MTTPYMGNAVKAPTRVVAVTSGKGGVGKTTISINLSIALAQSGQRVTLLDADLGLANVDVLLGLTPKKTLEDVLNGDCALKDVLVRGPGGVQLVPATSGVQRMAELAVGERAGLLHAFSELADVTDILVVDTAAGIAANAMQFCDASHEVIVVVCNDPASITDAYATIKVLNQRNRRSRFRILVNRTNDDEEAFGLYKRLLGVTDRFLDVSLDFAGSIPFDAKVPHAARRQIPVVESDPSTTAARAFRKLATTVNKWTIPTQASGQLEFFVERIIEADQFSGDRPATPASSQAGSVGRHITA